VGGGGKGATRSKQADRFEKVTNHATGAKKRGGGGFVRHSGEPKNTRRGTGVVNRGRGKWSIIGHVIKKGGLGRKGVKLLGARTARRNAWGVGVKGGVRCRGACLVGVAASQGKKTKKGVGNFPRIGKMWVAGYRPTTRVSQKELVLDPGKERRDGFFLLAKAKVHDLGEKRGMKKGNGRLVLEQSF